MDLPSAVLRPENGHKPILLAGPTGSGKSALAIEIAARTGGVIVNADALQVYTGWRILTARPSDRDLETVPHHLYGHVARDVSYSAGHWIRDVAPFLEGPVRPIIVGGTGLYFMALTEGLAEIPATPPEIRMQANQMSDAALRAALDADTRARIDLANRARVQRAWEVQRSTGRGLASWQDATPAPLLPATAAIRLLIDAPKTDLLPRLEARFDAMLRDGALDEVRRNLATFDAARPGDKAIGAPELVDFLKGHCTLDEARARAIIGTRQYAKRQRTWFRARMSNWTHVPMTGSPSA